MTCKTQWAGYFQECGPAGDCRDLVRVVCPCRPFMVEQRSKEISIRLVLGASHGERVWITGPRTFLLVLVSILLAAPLAWYAMDQWLQNFTYRTELVLVDICTRQGIGVGDCRVYHQLPGLLRRANESGEQPGSLNKVFHR